MESSQHGMRERHLLLLNDDQARVIELTSNVVTLGRHPSNDIVIDCDVISRQHTTFFKIAVFNQPTHEYRLIDGGPKKNHSKNGIAINNKRCYMHKLEHGDIITFSEMIKGIYLKITVSDQKYDQYISIISKSKEITPKTRDSIDALTRVFNQGTKYLKPDEPTSIMVGT